MHENKIDTRTAKKIEFLTHTFFLQKIGDYTGVFCTINDNIYFEMEFSSRNLSYSDSLHDRNLASLAGCLQQMFGVEPNPDFVFMGTPIENIRYLMHRFIKSIFNENNSNLSLFSSDNEFKKFCKENSFEYINQAWFNHFYINDSTDLAESFLIRNSLVFQELYFPKNNENSFQMPSLHDADKLSRVYNFKSNFNEIYKILENNRIDRLYHFTDRENLQSILKYGLLSQDELLRQNIHVKYASSSESRHIDKEMKLNNYVRLSFTKTHPMMFTSMTAYGLKPIVIEINPLVALLPNVYFSDRNTLRKGAEIGQNAIDLMKINFSVIKSNIAYYNMTDLKDKIHYQAEVIIPSRIGPEMILNYQDLASTNY